MRIPIAHSLAWPERLQTDVTRLDLTQSGRLDFFPPDEARFPALRLARDALRAGGGAPTVLNAANEVAVAAFLDRRIGFLDIARVVGETMGRLGMRATPDLGHVMALDAEARRVAEGLAGARATAA
jgi:1-deoxy-D-xylulose-5-phosphate reductoisomerase